MKTAVVVRDNEFDRHRQAVHVDRPEPAGEDDIELLAIRKTVKERLKEAGDILKRCPQPPERLGLLGGGGWPQMVYSRDEAAAWRGVRVRPATPTAAEISRLDETLEWLMWLDGKVRPVVFACMFFGYRKVARQSRNRCSHETIRRTFERGVSVIAGRLLKKRAGRG